MVVGRQPHGGPRPKWAKMRKRAVQLINRVRVGCFFRSRYFVSVLAFFGIRLESIRACVIYSGGTRFRLLMAELEISRTNCARSEVEIRARPTSGIFVRFFLEPKSFKIPPSKCQWGPIGHLYNLGLSMGSLWWPYGGKLSDPFSDFLPPTSHMKKNENILCRWVIGPLNR